MADEGRASLPLSQYVIDRWTIEDGLPQDKLQAFAQTPDGYLWVGTEAGIARFDGVRFAPFASPEAPQLRGASARALLTTPDGALWIGTDRHGIARLRDGKTVVIRGSDGDDPTFIRALLRDHLGRLWAGAAGGLFRIEEHGLVHVDIGASEVFA